MIKERKVVLCESDAPVLSANDKRYLVVELHGTVELSIGDRLTKREVEDLIARPRIKVVVRGERAARARA